MSLRPLHYILDPEIGNGHVPIPCDDIVLLAKWQAQNPRHVAKDTVGSILLSTVFLCLDHEWDGGPPVLFETMAFDTSDQDTYDLGGVQFQSMGEEISQLFDRYSTWEQAEWGHKEKLEILTGMVKL